MVGSGTLASIDPTRLVNELSESAVCMIADGDWPCLERVCLNDNVFSTASIDKLVDGKWPLLNRLGVYYDLLNASTITTLVSGHC